MQNPWSELPGQSPFVLATDIGSIDKYNKLHNNDEKIVVESIPEPFIGNPQSAKVVLLSLNPGHSEEDAKAHSDGNFRKAMMHNLRHEEQECPFYGLNPKFAWTACGIWWRAHTRRLHDAGLTWECISRGLLVVQWFPYIIPRHRVYLQSQFAHRRITHSSLRGRCWGTGLSSACARRNTG